MSEQMLHVLLALADGTLHGYAIMRRIAEDSGGTVQVGPGTLYGAIKRFLTEGLIEEIQGEAGDDPRRRYYRLTALGRRRLRSELRRLDAILHLAYQRHALPRNA